MFSGRIISPPIFQPSTKAIAQNILCDVTAVLILIFHLWGACTSASVIAQSGTGEKPKIKNFGSSLKEFGKKKRPDAAAGEQKKEQRDENTIRIRTELVSNNVLVLDRKGNSISGLTADDFIVTDNGRPQKIEMFSYGENVKVPRSWVLIMENSWSMFPYRETSIKAAGYLIDKLPPQDRIAIVTDSVKLLAPFTNDKRLLKSRLNTLWLEAQSDIGRGGFDRGNGLQYDALLATLRELFDDEDIVPIVIFQTDGKELMVLKPAIGPGYYEMERKFGFSDILEQVERSRATIYSIIPEPRFVGVSADEWEKSKKLARKLWNNPDIEDPWLRYVAREQQCLCDVAQISGGYCDFLERPADTEKVYATLLEAINRRYFLGYYPKEPSTEGKRHAVKIEVKGHPEYVVIGRKTYFPQ